jgi:Endonuclease/Exonuclease/phosphatase family
MSSIRVGWWNLQNLFDTDDDPISADLEFTVAKGWTPEVYAAKLANLAVAINELHDGQGPELLGVCEVEGDDVFQELLGETGNPHLKIVSDPAGTSDLRGIDTSLAYDDRKLRPLEQRSHVVHLRYATRDIFEVLFEVVETGERLVAIATHWPSRTKGRWRSDPLRIALAENIAFIVRDHVRFDAERYLELKAADDLAAVRARWEAKVLIMGDLNDEPADRSLTEHLQTSSELDRVTGPTNAPAGRWRPWGEAAARVRVGQRNGPSGRRSSNPGGHDRKRAGRRDRGCRLPRCCGQGTRGLTPRIERADQRRPVRFRRRRSRGSRPSTRGGPEATVP